MASFSQGKKSILIVEFSETYKKLDEIEQKIYHDNAARIKTEIESKAMKISEFKSLLNLGIQVLKSKKNIDLNNPQTAVEKFIKEYYQDPSELTKILKDISPDKNAENNYLEYDLINLQIEYANAIQIKNFLVEECSDLDKENENLKKHYEEILNENIEKNKKLQIEMRDKDETIKTLLQDIQEQQEIIRSKSPENSNMKRLLEENQKLKREILDKD